MIRNTNMRPALALKPKTLIDHTLIEIFDKNLFDMILIMTVGIKSFLKKYRARLWRTEVYVRYVAKSLTIKKIVSID